MQIYKSNRKTEFQELYDFHKQNQVGPALYSPKMPAPKIPGCVEKGSRMTF